MYLKYRVKIPNDPGKIYPSKPNKKGVVYINYEYARVYKPDKKYNVPKRTTIGKKCEDDDTMMYPNPTFFAYYPEEDSPEAEGTEPTRSSCIRIGAYLVIKKIIEEYKLDEMLSRIIGKDSGLFLDLAAYAIVSENNAGQYYPEYAYNHPLFTENMYAYSDAKISRFLSELRREQKITFLNDWNVSRDHRQKIYISYDSTNKNCQAGDVEIAEYGHAKDDKGLPVFNQAIAYDRNNREPLFYEEYPGSINDVSQLQFMIEKAKGYGYKNIGFILDRGYFSEPNIRCMDRCHYAFIIMVKGMKDLVSELIISNKGTFEESRGNYIRQFGLYGTTVKGQLFPSDQKPRYFHLFYSKKKDAAESAALDRMIDKQSKYLEKQQNKAAEIPKSFGHYFDLIYYHEGKADQKFMMARERNDVIDREMKLCGYFVIISSEKMTAQDALLLYKSRDGSEKLFRGDKSYLGGKSMRVSGDERVEAKLFIEFIALIIRNKIYTSLKDQMLEDDKKHNYMTVPAALRELDKIELVRQLNKRYSLDHAVTKTQKSILKAFGMNENDIKKKARSLGETMQKLPENQPSDEDTEDDW